jgi:hypothetical protein
MDVWQDLICTKARASRYRLTLLEIPDQFPRSTTLFDLTTSETGNQMNNQLAHALCAKQHHEKVHNHQSRDTEPAFAFARWGGKKVRQQAVSGSSRCRPPIRATRHNHCRRTTMQRPWVITQAHACMLPSIAVGNGCGHRGRCVFSVGAMRRWPKQMQPFWPSTSRARLPSACLAVSLPSREVCSSSPQS